MSPSENRGLTLSFIEIKDRHKKPPSYDLSSDKDRAKLLKYLKNASNTNVYSIHRERSQQIGKILKEFQILDPFLYDALRLTSVNKLNPRYLFNDQETSPNYYHFISKYKNGTIIALPGDNITDVRNYVYNLFFKSPKGNDDEFYLEEIMGRLFTPEELDTFKKKVKSQMNNLKENLEALNNAIRSQNRKIREAVPKTFHHGIATFNVCSLDHTEKNRISRIAKALYNRDLDIFALQEVKKVTNKELNGTNGTNLSEDQVCKILLKHINKLEKKNIWEYTRTISGQMNKGALEILCVFYRTNSLKFIDSFDLIRKNYRNLNVTILWSDVVKKYITVVPCHVAANREKMLSDIYSLKNIFERKTFNKKITKIEFRDDIRIRENSLIINLGDFNCESSAFLEDSTFTPSYPTLNSNKIDYARFLTFGESLGITVQGPDEKEQEIIEKYVKLSDHRMVVFYITINGPNNNISTQLIELKDNNNDDVEIQ